MNDVYQSYLELLDSLRSNVEELSALAKKKLEAAQNDDLTGLDSVLKREQALALSFRGLEQTKERLLSEMGMKEVPLSQLPARYPLELREKAQEAVAALQDEYQSYQESSQAARGKLEQNLYEVETMIARMGGPKEAEVAGPGYGAPKGAPQPPPSMKTDFRA